MNNVSHPLKCGCSRKKYINPLLIAYNVSVQQHLGDIHAQLISWETVSIALQKAEEEEGRDDN